MRGPYAWEKPQRYHHGCAEVFLWLLVILIFLGTLAVAFYLTSTAHAEGVRMKASMYGEGQLTATGHRFNPDGISAAHRTLRLGTKVTVRHNRRAVVVVINDRGPAAYTGRDIDLSRGAAKALAFSGVGMVTVERWPPLPKPRPNLVLDSR